MKEEKPTKFSMTCQTIIWVTLILASTYYCTHANAEVLETKEFEYMADCKKYVKEIDNHGLQSDRITREDLYVVQEGGYKFSGFVSYVCQYQNNGKVIYKLVI